MLIGSLGFWTGANFKPLDRLPHEALADAKKAAEVAAKLRAAHAAEEKKA